MNNKKKYFIVGIVLTLILAVIGVAYAYWRGVVQGNGSSISVDFDTVNIIFTDNTEIADAKVRPGWSTTKTFTVENQGTVLFKYDIYVKNLINTLVTDDYLQYKITSNNGYNMTEFESFPKSETATDTDLVTNIIVEAGEKQEYTIEIRYVNDPDFDQSDDIGKTFSGQLMIRENTSVTLYDKILADHPTVNTRTNFDTVLGDTTATTGVIYKESTYKEDTTTSSANNKDVYYFAGNVADNWIKFAGYYWRMIRTNEDGGIRLLYHGTSGAATDSYIATEYAYNSKNNNTMYAGYMYGTTGSIGNNRNNTTSPQIKTKLDSWYTSDLASYDSGVSKTAIYCNDRASGQYAANGTMYYAAYDRLIHGGSGRRPSYQCGQATGGYYNTSSSWTTLVGAYSSSAGNVADRFSKSTASGGNGQLSQPIGLMTADEVSFAGGMSGKNAPNTYYFLNSSGGSSTGGYWWWTMSPYYAISGAVMFYVPGSGSYTGSLNCANVNRTDISGSAVRPVISLKSCVTWESGDGTADNPYTVSVDDICASKEN